MERNKLSRATAVLALVAGAMAASLGLAQATGTGTHGVNRVEESNVRVEDPIRIKKKSGAQVIVAHITVEPGGHTQWHYHPGPHIVSVRTGTVEIWETDCSPPRTYKVGEGFFDPGRTRHPHIHTLRNPSKTQPAEVVITDIRTDDLRPTIPADPQPAPCFK